MRKYSYPYPTDYSRCQCGYSRKLDTKVSNGCKLHPDVPTAAQVKRGVWDERSKTWILPSGTVKQGRRPMFKPFTPGNTEGRAQ